jgi:sterol desaturase/sphingolipid hydroxylase (fatty acid hydroxylase superfamily)
MTAFVRTAVRYGYAPFMMLGINAAAFFAVINGHYLLLAPILLTAILATTYAERVSPCHDEWNHDHGDHAAHVWHAVVHETQNILGVLLIPLIQWTFHLKTGSLIGIWPRDWPILEQWLLAVLLVDFNLTFLHYLSHRYSFLWRLHSVHHGVGRLVGLNGLVRHPLHQLTDMALGSAPLILLGMPIEVSVLMAFSISVQLVIQHSNVDYALGPFRNHLSLGRIHHLHHTNWGKEGDVNFGLFLTLWDRLLGTFNPEPPRAITARDMGIDEVPNFPKSYREQLAFPFAYKPGASVPYAEASCAAECPECAGKGCSPAAAFELNSRQPA